MIKVPEKPYLLKSSSVNGGRRKLPKATPEVAKPTATPRFLLKQLPTIISPGV